MKKFYLTLLILFVTVASFAATITAVQNNGSWNSTSTWDLGRLPTNTDTIVIPANLTIKVQNWNLLTGVLIKVYGTLRLQNGKLSLYSTSQIIVYRGGTIMGNINDNITIAGVQKFLGSDGAVMGSKIANTSTGTNPNGFEPFSSMPVKFTGFYAKIVNQSVQLTWTTAEEFNNSHFEIQKSVDARSWNTIGSVAAALVPGITYKYQFIDKSNITTKAYYRLRQVDKDGNVSYSTIKLVQTNETGSLANVYVSAKQTVSIELNQPFSGKMMVRITSLNGQNVREEVFNNPSYSLKIQVPSAKPGLYIVQMIGQEVLVSKKVVL